MVTEANPVNWWCLFQIFTTHAEPGLDEFLTRKEQIEMENKHRDEEDKLYR